MAKDKLYKTYNPMSKEFQEEAKRLGLTGNQLTTKYKKEGKSVKKDETYVRNIVCSEGGLDINAKNNNTNNTNSVANNTDSERTIINTETKKYEKGTLGWVREQQKIKAHKAGFDNTDYWSKQKRNIKNINQVEKILEENKVEINDIIIFHRFWGHVDIKDNKEECWNWTAGISVGGYGQFWYRQYMAHAQRIAYMLTKGPIPEGLEVQHLCNNRSCCNPNHLELGGYYKNSKYMIECNRQAKGESNGNSKLTEDQVREIRNIYDEQLKLHPELKQFQIIKPIAKKYNISAWHTWRITSGNQWRHICRNTVKI